MSYMCVKSFVKLEGVVLSCRGATVVVVYFHAFLGWRSYAVIPLYPAKFKLLELSESDEHGMHDYSFIMERNLQTKVMKISTHKSVIDLSVDKLL